MAQIRCSLIGTVCLLVALLLSGCWQTVSYYDALSYKNLTDLKGEAKVFFGHCEVSGVTGSAALLDVKSLVLASAQAYEYEAGKTLNDDTVAQLEIIESLMFDVSERFQAGQFNAENGRCESVADSQTLEQSRVCLSAGYCRAKWLVLDTAFDIAIATEKSKLESN